MTCRPFGTLNKDCYKFLKGYLPEEFTPKMRAGLITWAIYNDYITGFEHTTKAPLLTAKGQKAVQAYEEKQNAENEN